MTWSFDPSLSTTRDEVRAKIGDTDINQQILQNEHVSAVLAIVNDDVLLASVELVDHILALVAKENDRSAVGMVSDRSQRFNHYQALRGTLREQLSTVAGGVCVGGVSKAQREAILSNPDLVPAAFDVGQDDNVRC